MSIKEAVLWALLGGSVAEVALIFSTMRPSTGKSRWTWAWSREQMPKFYVGMGCRFFLTGAAVAPLAATDRVPDALVAFLLGMGAPLLTAKMAAAADKIINQGGALPPSDDPTQPPPAGQSENSTHESGSGENEELTHRSAPGQENEEIGNPENADGLPRPRAPKRSEANGQDSNGEKNASL
jgi:hypothetical protein